MINLILEFLWDNIFYIVILVVCGVLSLLAKFTGTNKRAVKKIAKSHETMFHSGFRWAHVDLGSIPGADLSYYVKVTEEMAASGFQPLGDVEFLHVSEAEPKMRAGVRIFGVAHGTISAAVYHVKIRGWMGLISLLLTGKRNVRVTEYQTPLSDGRWIITTNAGTAVGLSAPDKIMRYNLSSSVGATDLLEMHVANVRQMLAVPNAPLPVAATTLDQVMALEAQQHELENQHRKETGAVTEQELATLCPDIPQAQRQALAAEAEKLKAVAK